MPSIIQLNDIKKALETVDVIAAMESGFIQYSNGKVVVPPVGELIFDQPPGDVHIKYGYIKNDDYYVIKIASGFHENAKLGISTGQGLMLLFSQQTGELISILLDEGHLTNIRTAAAGALVAKYFAPQKVDAIGIIGTGVQAKLQLLYLQKHNPYKTVCLWGRNSEKAQQLKADLEKDFDVQLVSTPDEVAQHCQIIVTTTAAEEPLLKAEAIQPGTLITAIGSDTAHKQELENEVLQKADLVIVDSISQSQSRGEVYQARKAGFIKDEKVVELGKAIQNEHLKQRNSHAIIVADLTGVAVQDIMIASAVYLNYKTFNK